MKLPKKPGWKSYAALCAITLAAYANSFGLGLALDANRLVTEDVRVRAATAASLKLILGTHYWFPHAQDRLYRPVTTLSFLVNYAVLGSGSNPAGYHVVNFLLHVVNVLLVFALARRVLGQTAPAFFAAALWAVHPVGTESVTNIAGRADLLAAMAVLGALLVYTGRAGRARPVAVALLCAAGCLAKESAAVLPGLMLLWDWSFGGVKKRARDYAAVLAAMALVFWMRERVFAAAPWPEMPFLDNPLRGMGFVAARLTAVKVIGMELALLAWPKNLAFDHSYRQIAGAAWRDPWVWVAAVVMMEIIIVVALRRRRDPVPFFAAGFCGLTLLPTANLVVLIGSVMAVRFLYLPAVGFAIAAAALVSRLRNRRLAYGILSAAVALLAVRTLARNPAWNSDLALASADVAAVPESFRAHGVLASALVAQDREANLDAALREAEAAWAIVESVPPAWNDDHMPGELAVLCRYQGDRLGGVDTAPGRAWYERSLGLAQRAAEIADARVKTFDELQREHGKPLPQRAGYEDVYLNLGVGYFALGRDREALDAFRKARVEDPRSTDAYNDAALAYARENDRDGVAAMVLEKVLVFGLTPAGVKEVEAAFGGCALSQSGNTVQVNYGCPAVARVLCRAAADLDDVFRAGRRMGNAREVEAAASARGCGQAAQ